MKSQLLPEATSISRTIGAMIHRSFLLALALWQIGPFTRPEGANPVIQPDKDAVFLCPIRKTLVHWESLHTFNPAAIVRNGRIYVLYRAEDDSGEMQIGMHTSRLGLAESQDGIHFTRRSAPVLFPDEDAQKEQQYVTERVTT